MTPIAPITHAVLSASGAHRWMACAGSIAAEADLPDSSSEYADEGTAAHELAAWALTTGKDARERMGVVYRVGARDFTVDADMADAVQTYVDYVRHLGGTLLVEQQVPIGAYTLEHDATGTADAVVLLDDELVVVDLKYGRGIRVDARDNPQLQMYALGAVAAFNIVHDFERVRMVIVQPRLNHISEDVLTLDELYSFGERVTAAAKRTREPNAARVAGAEQCRWCKAKPTCETTAREVLSAISDDFVDLTQPVAPQLQAHTSVNADNAALGYLYGALELIEGWCTAVRDRVRDELTAGRAVPGYKLIAGRRGARQWRDKDEAETALKALRLRKTQIYKMTPISPTDTDRLLKEGTIGTQRWTRLQKLVKQSAGAHAIVPLHDPRPAIDMAPSAEGLEAQGAQVDPDDFL